MSGYHGNVSGRLGEHMMATGLIDICQQLHATGTGTLSDYNYTPECRADDVTILRCALESWTPTGLPASVRYDAAVRGLIEATLAEEVARAEKF